VLTRTGPGKFPAGPRVISFKDETYNQDKSCEAEGDCPAVADPFTWHWDNIVIGQ
jgi:hypothetical protein